MKRAYHRWHSPSLDRDMELLVFGEGGTPVVVFPSSKGRFYEWEDFGMVGALRRQLDEGHNTLVCVDSVDAESFYNDHAHPALRVARHQQYESYVAHEVVPFARHATGSDFVIATGASFGGYHAANLYLKYPGLFGKLISLSGAFDISQFLDGYYDDAAKASNPAHFVQELSPEAVAALANGRVVLTTGEYDPCRQANDYLAGQLARYGLPVTLDITEGFGHDWPWWRYLIQKHIA